MKGFFTLTGVAACLGIAATLALQKVQNPLAQSFTDNNEAAWIAPAGAGETTAYFQTFFNLPASASRAWVRVEALSSFALYANRDFVVQNWYRRPVFPIQHGLSARGQKLSLEPPAMSLNYPREYQWGDQTRLRDAVYVDLTRYLRVGKNRLSLQVESRAAQAAIRVTGEMLLTNGQYIPITTNTSWSAAGLPRGGSLTTWLTGEVTASALQHPVVRPAPAGFALSIANQAAFAQPFTGRWLQAADGKSTWFASEFNITQPAAAPWIRIVTDRPYDLWINDTALFGRDKHMPAHSRGEWILGTRVTYDTPSRPAPLALDEIHSLFELSRGYPLESTRPETHLHHSAPEYGEGDGTETKKPRRFEEGLHPSPSFARLERLYRPWSLFNPPRQSAVQHISFIAHDLRGFLRPGLNRIRVRLAPATRKEVKTGIPGFAIDGLLAAEPKSSIDLSSPLAWSVQDTQGNTLTSVSTGNTIVGRDLPRLRWEPHRKEREVSFNDTITSYFHWIPAILLLWAGSFYLLKRSNRGLTWQATATELTIWTLPFLFLLLGIFALSAIFAEIQEAWLFALSYPWWLALGISLSTFPLAAALAILSSRFSSSFPEQPANSLVDPVKGQL